MIPICRKSRIVARSSFVESRSSSKKSAIAKNAPLMLKRNRMKESGGGSAPKTSSWNIHPTFAIPHVAQPKPTNNQKDLFRPCPRRAAPIAIAAAIPLPATCSTFPRNEPIELGPSVSRIVTCSTTNTADTIISLRAKGAPQSSCGTRTKRPYQNIEAGGSSRLPATKERTRLLSGHYFSHVFFRNSYRPRCSSFAAFDCPLKCITCASPLGLYAGHCGRPAPFGFPVRAKFAQYFRINSLSALSSLFQSVGILHSSVPNTYSISLE